METSITRRSWLSPRLCFRRGDVLAAFQFQESFGIAVANVLNHTANQAEVVWHFAVDHVFAKHIAKNASKVLMSNEGHETTRVR